MRSPLTPDPVTLDPGLTPETVAALAARSARRDSVASFQALLAAVDTSVRTVFGPLGEAEGAALSLRQRETVAEVATALHAAVDALSAGVSDQARCLRRRRPADRVRAVLRPAPGWLPRLRQRAVVMVDDGAARPTWLVAVGAAVAALGQTADHVATLGAAQPEDSSARALADRAAAALRQGRDALLADVARMLD